MTESVTAGDLTFEVRRSDHRDTIAITVDRDGALILHAPAEADTQRLRDAAASKAEWVYTKLAEKELLLHGRDPHEYVPGEGFHYLGRSYRLKLVDQPEESPPLRLRGGWFELHRDQRDVAPELFRAWYIRNGQRWLQRRTERWADRLHVTDPTVDVRDLGHRWGSCGVRALNYHWRTMALPPRIVDYVIVHELAHVHEPRHTREFWERIGRVMPDYPRRKAWLAANGAAY